MPHVCMVIEGAYPYITGGVSAWCHKLISDIKDVDFTLLVVLPASYRGKNYKYDLPPNVVDVLEVWLDIDYFKKKIIPTTNTQREEFFKEIKQFHTSMKLKNYGIFKIIAEYLSDNDNSSFNLHDLIKSKQAISTLFDIYQNARNDSGFMKYFWTWKSTHLPIFKILNFPLPRADVYHAVSTGYAGLLTVLAKLRLKIPFVLTEHGIYAMEREDELMSSELIDNDQKHLWIQFFHGLCRLSYSFADKVITLFRGNLIIEVANNAKVDLIEIIPNGVDIELYSSLKKIPSDKIRIALVARVVPIKDVKTFIRAVVLVSKVIPVAEFYIVGPTDEDEDYYEECVALVKELNLEDKLTFTGKVNMTDYYPRIDILVLTSAREAQPLVLLEAMCSGIPCIATNVGACSNMLEDVGFITTPAKPEETAEAIIKLCESDKLRQELSKKGKQKVIMSYNVKDVINSYRGIYFKYSKQKEFLSGIEYGRNRIPVT